ncbi:flagellar export protein FliJ [Kordiimonas aestuarii]|uniref:flagellar export protein FliJ n=1 Tax=Kordiimonas aestuarii TaxID=1005925 RepID=UPI0021CFD336|nr:flagellar FliJ family protein [Kordiimonas aestuarii]
MSRLDGIIRLRKWELDEQRRVLAVLQAERDSIAATIDMLEEEKAEQARTAGGLEVSTLTLGLYLEGVRKKQDMLREDLARKDEEVDEHRDKVAESFRELKIYEIAHEQEMKRVKAAEDKEEQEAFDELGIQNHARQEAMTDSRHLKMRR